MRITKTRLAVRIGLVVAIVAVGGAVFRFWQIRQPAYHWQRAVAALAVGDDARAELELRGCLAQLPNHAQAHFRLSELLLRRARQDHPSATVASIRMASIPEAMQHLRRAAELAPDSLEIQRVLLTALVEANRLDDAEGVATMVQRLDPKDPVAIVMGARQSLRRRDFTAATARLATLTQYPPQLTYTAWWIDSELGRLTEQPQRQAAAIAAATQHALAAPAASFSGMSTAERGALSALLLLGVETAPDAVAALKYTQQALRIVDVAPTTAPVKTGSTPRGTPPLATIVGQLGSSLQRRFPTASLSADARAQAVALTEQLAELCRQQIAAPDGGPPTAYRYLAERALADGNATEALALIDRGLTAATAAQLPARDKLGLHLLAGGLLVSAGRHDEASPHIAPLLADPTTAPQAQMLAGSIALAQARYADARKSFEEAAQRLGPTLQVQLALAATHLALGRPAEALPYLKDAVARLDEFGPAEKAWLARYIGDELALRRALYESLLAVDRTDEAAPHLAALRGTAQEPTARIALAGWHWRHNGQARADAVLAAARQEYPDHIGLTLAHAAVAAGRGSAEDGDALVGAFAAMKPEELPRQLALLQWRTWRGETAAALASLPELRERFGPLPVLQSIEAQLLLAADRPQEALAAADTLRANLPGDRTGNLLAASAALRLGRPDDAADRLDTAGAGPLVDLSRANLLAATGNEGAALDLLVSALRHNGAAPQASTAIGTTLDSLAQRQGLRAALKKADQLLAKQPDEPALLAAHASLALAANQPDAALEDLKRLETARPETALVPYMRAQVLTAKGDLGGAQTELNVVIAKDPKQVDARIFAAELARRQGDFPTSLRHASAALKLDPARADAAALAAGALTALRRSDEATVVLNRLIQAAPQQPHGYILLARHFVAIGRVSDALATLTAAQQRLPREWDLLAAHVATLAESGQSEAAVELARRRAAEHPDAFDAARLGWLMLRLNQFAAARTFADQFLATAGPREAEACWLLGNIALMDGSRQQDLLKLSEAQNHFRRVLALQPGHLGATNNLAWVLATSLNQPQQALELMRGMLARPEFKDTPAESLPPTVIDTLAVVLLKAGRADEARSLLARAVRQHPQSAKLHFQFGLTQLAANNYAEAEAALTTALRLGLVGQQAERARQELEAMQQPKTG